MSEIFAIKEIGAGIINNLSYQNVVPLNIENKVLKLRMTSDFMSPVVTRLSIPGMFFNVKAGRSYKIKIFGAYKSAAVTTGGSLGFVLTNGGAGTIFGFVKMNIVHTNVAAPEQVITDINTVNTTVRSFVTSTGVGTVNTPETILGELVFECTTNGTFEFQWGSEIAASESTILRNTIFKITEI